jgi:ribosomal subunit interface protein
MEIRVSGHQVETGEGLQQHVRGRMTAIADKYFSRAISAHITFGKGPYERSFVCDIVAHVMQGVILKGSGESSGAHQAFDQAADRIEKQLRRYVGRLKKRHVVAEAAFADGAVDADYRIFDIGDDEGPAPDNPPIIAETKVDIPDASVSDAVMMMDLRNTNALFFRNRGTGAYNMVYRRGDGTIGWVEPQHG